MDLNPQTDPNAMPATNFKDTNEYEDGISGKVFSEDNGLGQY
jgi:hypothetical protein